MAKRGRPPGSRCKDCGLKVPIRFDLSRSRLCPACWDRRFQDNIDQLIAHDGPYFDHWRRRMAASVGAVLLDDVRESA